MKKRPYQQPEGPFEPAGFASVDRLVTVDGRVHAIELLLPIKVRDALEAEERRRLLREREESAARQQVECAPARAESLPPPPPWPAPRHKQEQHDRQDCAKVQEQQALWDAHAAAGSRMGRLRHYPVFDRKEAMALFRRIALHQQEERDRYQRVYDQLAKNGLVRTVARPSAAALPHLAVSQPHMAAVVEFVQDQLELARRGRKPLRIPPILLAGEAGIGKTHFAQALASALGAPLSIQRLDSDLTPALMLGSDRKWGNTQHGLLFELLALGQAANPVIVLDEIDKINRREQQVQASLYSLLEEVSARALRDISLEFEFDASLVTYIATANDPERLDAPLRSRFKEFHIQVPTAEQCLVLAREVILATIRNTAVRGFSVQSNRLERDLAHLTARQIQQATREAIARAVKAERMCLQRRDLPPWVLGPGESAGAPGGYLH